jgi:4-amino-4-deoxy-L-arabinose transferase-like glycosyltransferase
VLSLERSQSWISGQIVALSAALGLPVVGVLIGRELWLARPLRAFAVGVVLAAYPVLLRMGVLFHPETTFAFLVALALLLTMRANRSGWSPAQGLAVGAVCGLAVWARASAAVVIVVLAVFAAVSGGREARRFLAAGALAVVIVAGPWWAIAYHLWGNPLQSDLDRPGYMLTGGEPVSFFLSAPLRSLVMHPYRPDFQNELLPKLHAELWSDWFGGIHALWAHPSRLDRVTASTQSVLGLVGDALALAGLCLVGLPAVARIRRPDMDPRRRSWALLAGLAVVSFAAFVITLVRFPQTQGDPIKSSYLLFTAPCWAAFTVAAWVEARRRSPWLHAGLVLVAALYVGSYVATLSGAFGL